MCKYIFVWFNSNPQNILFLYQLTQICLVFINHNTEEAYFFDHYYFPFN